MDTNYCNSCPGKVKGQPVLISPRVWRCPACGNIEDYSASDTDRIKALMHLKDQVREFRMYGAWEIDWWAIDREIICVLGLATSSAPVPA